MKQVCTFHSILVKKYKTVCCDSLLYLFLLVVYCFTVISMILMSSNILLCFCMLYREKKQDHDDGEGEYVNVEDIPTGSASSPTHEGPLFTPITAGGDN